MGVLFFKSWMGGMKIIAAIENSSHKISDSPPDAYSKCTFLFK
jgi:hypothetical protein